MALTAGRLLVPILIQQILDRGLGGGKAFSIAFGVFAVYVVIRTGVAYILS